MHLFKRYIESLRLLEFLQNENTGGTTEILGPFTDLKPKSDFTPPFSQCGSIQLFIKNGSE